ncbi:pVI [Snake adenovirus 1]|uniref:Pre-protein VI n=1 Tax=Snake adenovirus serotype 1 TaxID=189830 RepID=CAP6_ADES1|nr:pVI [Snake adenovirus 1]Q8JN68.1 RecName: Full=Pre-protein VI; Short=pVI; Contains: RecName: Full=Endosome lysis protein; Contains: RecName: Full=Protease cofactor; AltName: Full=pVI-C [Snake adenovirus 1]AAL92451.1 pVI [Snake adenovirus 1]
MAYSRLAPHCGLPVYGHHIGNSEMSGGFSWSSLGSSLSSGLSRIGSFLGSTAQRIGNSQGFQQAKEGFLKSGVLENVGSLAGQTVSSLADIGRLKLESDLQKLRERALGAQQQQLPPLTQEQLAQLLASTQTELPSSAPAVPMPIPAPVPPLVTGVRPGQMRPEVLPPDRGVALGPLIEEPAPRPIAVPGSRPRKRKRVRGWGSALEDMLGDGVCYRSKRYCY